MELIVKERPVYNEDGAKRIVGFCNCPCGCGLLYDAWDDESEPVMFDGKVHHDICPCCLIRCHRHFYGNYKNPRPGLSFQVTPEGHPYWRYLSDRCHKKGFMPDGA